MAQAVVAFRKALEVRTREQLPTAWAATQNDLGNALYEQAIRTEGPQGAELLAQAVAAYRSALEVFTREAFPPTHEGVQKNLAKAEDRLRRLRFLQFFEKTLSEIERK